MTTCQTMVRRSVLACSMLLGACAEPNLEPEGENELSVSANEDNQEQEIALHTEALIDARELHRISATMTIDGNADESAWRRTDYFNATNVVRGALDPGDPYTGFLAMWDTNNLYVYVYYADDAQPPFDSVQPWEDDSIEIYVDGDGSAGTTYDGRNDFQYIFRRGDPAVRYGVNSRVNSSGIAWSYTSYSLEVAIPWTTIGITPAEGRRIGLEVQRNDDDNGGARDSKVATFATTDDAWTQPRLFSPFSLGSYRYGIPPSSTPVIDGVFEPAYYPSPYRSLNFTVRGSGDPSYNDLSGSWYAVYDAEALYVLVSVTDDLLVNDWNSEPWEDDSVEVYVDGNRSAGNSYDGYDDSQYIFRLDDPTVYVGARSRTNTSGIQHAFGPAWGNGYSVEIKLPWSTLGVTSLYEDKPIGIDVHVNDDDDGGVREHKRACFARVDDAWQRPALFGYATLSSQPW